VDKQLNVIDSSHLTCSEVTEDHNECAAAVLPMSYQNTRMD